MNGFTFSSRIFRGMPNAFGSSVACPEYSSVSYCWIMYSLICSSMKHMMICCSSMVCGMIKLIGGVAHE